MKNFYESTWYSKLSEADLKKLEMCIQVQKEIDEQNEQERRQSSMQSELTGQNEVVRLQSKLLNIEAKSEYIGDSQGSEGSMTKRNSGQEQRSGSRSVKAT